MKHSNHIEPVKEMEMKQTLHINDKKTNIGKASIGDKYTLLVEGKIKSANRMMESKDVEYTLEIDSIKIQSGKEKTKAGDAIDKRIV